MEVFHMSSHSGQLQLGPYRLNQVVHGDCLRLASDLPDESIDIIVTSPPYWGQRMTQGNGTEPDPREYLRFLIEVFAVLLPKLKLKGLLWINLGDAYNTPVNWRIEDHKFSSLGPDKTGLPQENSAYVKPRAKRKPFIENGTSWLQYGNLLALPYRLILALCDIGYLYRGEIIWKKKNPMPEGRCRRPHRRHESIYLLARSERHDFRITPPVPSVWEFPNEKIDGPAHFSRFPLELPRLCIGAYGQFGPEVVVLDPFSGSGTTNLAASYFGCSHLGFEIDEAHAAAANKRLLSVSPVIPFSI